MTSRHLALLALLAMCASGCVEENVPQKDLDGVVIVPGDLVEDGRTIGTVYVGVYEAFDPEQLGYPYPATGPQVGDNPIGDALPYGGTSIGEFMYGCYQVTRCEIVTGRYGSLTDMLEINPLFNDDGTAVTEEEYFDQCAWYFGWNSIDEFVLIGESRLDFRKNGDGDWEAPFRAWHTRVPEGAILWGFVDNDDTSCSIDRGAVNRRRSEDDLYFREGAGFRDVLNFPDKYITAGDLITGAPTTVHADQLDGYEVIMDFVKD
jgi:hypothetical protein